jgi:hydroxymethylbilane synthase
MSTTLRIGSRGSKLALWQANHIADRLRSHGHTVEIEIIRTTGDRMQDPNFVPPASFDGASLDSKGIFIKEIEEALADGRIDLAVHSLKDLPTQLEERFAITATPERADARDAFVCEPYWALHTLPMYARVGTTSPRRQAQLLALRPDLEFVETRGNIDTRLRKLAEGQCDALVLAAAGLDRIGRTENVHQRFAYDELCPAPGQGALAIETRSPQHPLATDTSSRDAEVHAAARALNHPITEFAITVERTVLHALGGGCQLPVGAFCHQLSSGNWHLHTQVVAQDGDQVITAITEASPSSSAAELGEWAARELERQGALALLGR